MLRLKTAQTYLGLLGDGLAPMAYAQGAQVKLTAHVSGPLFTVWLVRRDWPRFQDQALASKLVKEADSRHPRGSERQQQHLQEKRRRPDAAAAADAAQPDLQGGHRGREHRQDWGERYNLSFRRGPGQHCSPHHGQPPDACLRA